MTVPSNLGAQILTPNFCLINFVYNLGLRKSVWSLSLKLIPKPLKWIRKRTCRTRNPDTNQMFNSIASSRSRRRHIHLIRVNSCPEKSENQTTSVEISRHSHIIHVHSFFSSESEPEWKSECTLSILDRITFRLRIRLRIKIKIKIRIRIRIRPTTCRSLIYRCGRDMYIATVWPLQVTSTCHALAALYTSRPQFMPNISATATTKLHCKQYRKISLSEEKLMSTAYYFFLEL